jgi:periplasmic protein TonB
MNKSTQRLVNFLVATLIWGGLLFMVATRKIKNPTEMWEKVQTVVGIEIKPPPPPPPKPKDLPPPPPPVARPVEAPPQIDVAPVFVPVAPPVAPPPACQASGPSIKKGFNTDRAYPDLAVRRGIEGKVTVRYTVNADGTVGSVEVVSADPPGYFERAVETEFRKMRWNPAKDGNCQPTTSGSQTQNVVFRLG